MTRCWTLSSAGKPMDCGAGGKLSSTNITALWEDERDSGSLAGTTWFLHSVLQLQPLPTGGARPEQAAQEEGNCEEVKLVKQKRYILHRAALLLPRLLWLLLAPYFSITLINLLITSFHRSVSGVKCCPPVDELLKSQAKAE